MRVFSPGRKTPYLIQWLFGLISIFMPVSRTESAKPIVVFGAFHGDDFRGNTRVIFEQFHSDHRIHAVWLSRNPDVVKQLNNRYGNTSALILHSFEALQLLTKARMVLYTHGTSDFPFVRIPKNALQVHTYHGLPTKRGEYMKTDGSHKSPGLLHRLILNHRFGGINYFFTSSPFVGNIYAKRFNLRQEQLVETGYPSTDAIINAPKMDRKSFPDCDVLIVYAPTYRRRTKTRWFPFDDMNWADLDQFLSKHRITLALRAHPNEQLSVTSFQKYTSRITDGASIGLSDLLVQTDGIITDYSGIYLEGLLRDIPSIFIPYDIDRYERGLPYAYDEVTPGPKVGTYEDFKKALEDVVSDRASSYQSQRYDVKGLFFSKTDGMSTQRAIRFIEDTLPKLSANP